MDTSIPHSARVYDWWLGGKDNFAVDRAMGAAMIQAIPGLREMAAENRRFVHRVARYLVAEAGIRQFLDVGTGIPTAPNLHEVAQQLAPETRVVYVDNDPIVLVHARALMVSTPQGRSEYIHADLREPAKILADSTLTGTLDLDQPQTSGSVLCVAGECGSWFVDGVGDGAQVAGDVGWGGVDFLEEEGEGAGETWSAGLV